MSEEPGPVPMTTDALTRVRHTLFGFTPRQHCVALVSAGEIDGLGGNSYLTCDPLFTVSAHGRQTLITDTQRGTRSLTDAPLLQVTQDLVREVERSAEPANETWPIAIGALSYDFGREFVHLPKLPEARAWFGIYPAVAKISKNGELNWLGTPQGCAALKALSGPHLGHERLMKSMPWVNSSNQAQYLRSFQRIQEFISSGDVYQVNLTRELWADLPREDAPSAFLTAAQRSAAPYCAYLDLGKELVLSASPERLIYRRPANDVIETRPIKGTEPRSSPDGACTLRSDPKQLAEHLMIVDLLRNDLGKVARLGSVKVTDFAREVALPGLWHMISTISAQVPPTTSAADIVAAMFPGGSITGAPKRRAMEIISQVENFDRGFYTGAIGYLGADQAMDFSIAIRTATWRDGRLFLGVGGGIVADSQWEAEWQESQDKAGVWRG